MTSGVWAVVLAAGESSRFGSPKLLAPLGGRPLITHLLQPVERLCRSGDLAGAVVVHRSDDTALPAVVPPGMTALPASGPDPLDSLTTALRHLEPVTPAAAVILLADQPTVTTSRLRAVLRAGKAAPTPACRPVYRKEAGQPGHPVFLRADAWPVVLSAPRTGSGLAALFASGSIGLSTFELPGTNPDVDTPSDLAALAEGSADDA